MRPSLTGMSWQQPGPSGAVHGTTTEQIGGGPVVEDCFRCSEP